MRLGALLLAALAASMLIEAGPAAAACDGGIVQLSETGGAVVCPLSNSCDGVNTYNPGALGCVLAFGLSIPTPGRDQVYTVIMPPYTLLDVTVIPIGNWDVAVYASTSDDPDSVNQYGSCFAGIDEGFNGGEEFLRGIANESAVTDTIFIIVDSALTSSTTGCGQFRLEFQSTIFPGGGDQCATALPVTLSGAEPVRLRATTCGHTNQVEVGEGDCAFAFGADRTIGPDRIYRVTVDVPGPWSVNVTPASAWDVTLVVASECDVPSSCLGAADWFGAGQGESLLGLANPVAGGVYHLYVDSTAGGDCGAFDLELRTGGGTPIVRSTWGRLKSRYGTSVR